MAKLNLFNEVDGMSTNNIKDYILNNVDPSKNLNLKNLNNCEVKNLMKMVSFNELKNDIINKEKTTITEEWLLTISSVEEILTVNDDDLEIFVGIRIIYTDGHKDDLYIDGTIDRGQGRRYVSPVDSGYRRLAISGGRRQTSINFERVMLIALSIMRDEIPLTLSKAQANSLDASANGFTALKRNIKPNFSLDNLEWCTGDDNKKHRTLMNKVWKKTHLVFQISAYDPYLNQVVKYGSAYDILMYLLPRYRCVGGGV